MYLYIFVPLLGSWSRRASAAEEFFAQEGQAVQRLAPALL